MRTLDRHTVRELLVPFGITLISVQMDLLLAYLDLLGRWNRKINLTAIRTSEECVTRHFGESMYLGRWVRLAGRNLDVGSGAGFPGLALKILFADLATTLLEPVGKKRAFLKEVVRTCGMKSVEVRPERLEEYLTLRPEPFNSATSRAVGDLSRIAETAAGSLKPGGRLCLWLGEEQGRLLAGQPLGLAWDPPVRIPGTRQNAIWIGNKVSE